MYSATALPLAAAISNASCRTSLMRVLISRPVTLLEFGCQRHRTAYSSASTEPLDREKADALVLRFTEEERTTLLSALQSYQAKKVKAEYEGEFLASLSFATSQLFFTDLNSDL